MEAPSAIPSDAFGGRNALAAMALRAEVVARLYGDRAWKPDDGGGYDQGGGHFEEAGQFNNEPIAPGLGASVRGL